MIRLTFSPAIVLGEQLELVLHRDAQAGAGAGQRQADADVDVGQGGAGGGRATAAASRVRAIIFMVLSPWGWWVEGCQRGAMRSAPSRRITSPLRWPLVTMWQASCGELLGLAQARRERDGRGQRLLHRLGQLLHQRRGEQARRDGADADAVLRQVARHRQRHADQAALGGAVGLLADLAVEGGDRGGEQHHAALAVFQRRQLGAGARRTGG